MKTIDEIRGFLSKSPSVVYPDEVLGYVDAIENELKECYIEGPKGADGDVWHVGDLVVGEVNPNNPKRVERMLWYGPDSGWQLETDSIIYPCPERPRHYKSPTVEDILREFALKCEDAGYAGPKVEEIASEFAERLQLKERDDG